MPDENPKADKTPTKKWFSPGRCVSQFVDQLNALKRTEELVMPLLVSVSNKVNQEFDTFLKEGGIEFKTEENRGFFNVPLAKVRRFEKLKKRATSYSIAFNQTPASLLVALVSRYDAFLGQLLRSLFYIKPEMLNQSQRAISFQQLVDFSDMSAARDYVVEKEVESVIRESHPKQFEWIENRFDIPLRKGLVSWPRFIEVTERRNLFVHTAGTISSQYLEVCKKHGAVCEEAKLGETLTVTGDYFATAFECLFEIGVKLGHVLWRKLAPGDLEQADQDLNDICFELLKDEEFSLAKELLLFANEVLKKHSSNLMRRVFLINLALAHRGLQEKDKAERLIAAEDWSDSVRSLGREAKGIHRVGYETWPLFKEFRGTSRFQNAFRDIYGEDFEMEAGIGQTPALQNAPLVSPITNTTTKKEASAEPSTSSATTTNQS